MSHFTVLVPAHDEKHLAEVLLPYHEYECTGIEEYVQFIPTDLAEAAEKLKENNERWQGSEHPEYVYDSLDAFIPEYYGAKQNEEGVWGRRTNPNAQWDWWVIGGRWRGVLILKDGAKKADSALAKDIDWEAMRQLNTDRAIERYRRWQGFKVRREAGETITTSEMWDGGFAIAEDIEDLENLSEDDYVLKHGKEDAITFAFIDLQGGWNERAHMGWFGVTSNPQPNYDKVWWEFVASIPAEHRVYVVDCHI